MNLKYIILSEGSQIHCPKNKATLGLHYMNVNNRWKLTYGDKKKKLEMGGGKR